MMTVCPTQRDKRERFVFQSVCPWLSACDVSIKGRKPNHEVNVWSLPDIAISNSAWVATFILIIFIRSQISRESL